MHSDEDGEGEKNVEKRNKNRVRAKSFLIIKNNRVHSFYFCILFCSVCLFFFLFFAECNSPIFIL
jgi:hypothetical protein